MYNMSKAAIAALGAVLLTSCGGGAEDAAGMALTAQNARMVLPPVEGNPAALYFDLSYDSEADGNVVLRGARVAGASSAMVHEYMELDFEMQMVEVSQIVIEPGQTISFVPEGRHVMVFEPDASLTAGGSTQVTLRFAGGSEFTFDADIRDAGDGRE